MTSQIPFPSIEQLDRVIRHCTEKADAWRSIANGARGLLDEEEQHPPGDARRSADWKILLAGVEKLAEVNIAEAEANRDAHEALKQQVQSSIVIPGLH